MDLLLTSYGIGTNEIGWGIGNPFFQCPPLFFSEKTCGFQIDYAALLMFDRIIVNEVYYERLLKTKYPKSGLYWNNSNCIFASLTKDYFEFFRFMNKEGRLVLKNFNSFLEEQSGLMEMAIKYDMINPAGWAKSLENSFQIWVNNLDSICRYEGQAWLLEQSTEKIEEPIFGTVYEKFYLSHRDRIITCISILKNWKKRLSTVDRELAAELLRNYLLYIDANIILSHKYDVPFIDWSDLNPFYEKKFKIAGFESPPLKPAIDQAHKLFEVIFPAFSPLDYKSFVKVLDDKRIVKLRELVSNAVEKNIEFDSEFAIQTLKKILKIEHKVYLRRKIVGLITKPLDLFDIFGFVVKDGLEAIANKYWSDRPKEKYSWFYLINSIDASQID